MLEIGAVVGEHRRPQSIAFLCPGAHRRAPLLCFDRAPHESGALELTRLGRDAGQPSQSEDHHLAVADLAHDLERLASAGIRVARPAERELAVHELAEHPRAPPQEPGLSRQVRAPLDQVGALLDVPAGVLELPDEGDRL